MNAHMHFWWVSFIEGNYYFVAFFLDDSTVAKQRIFVLARSRNQSKAKGTFLKSIWTAKKGSLCFLCYARPNKLRCVVCSYCAIQIRNWLLRLYFPCIFTYSNQPWFFFARVNQFFLLLSGKIFTFGTPIGKVIVCCVTLLCQLTQNSV